ncbi:MAG: GNAT family N-acetyltransferase [Legionella sp.]|jgi:ribosomal-protein-alanine N-acetyltransferase
MTDIPLIITERLILRPFTLLDLDDFALICADPEVMRFIGNGKAVEKEVTQGVLAWIIAQYEELGFGLLAVTLKENNKFLGFCGLIKQTIDNETHIELGYRLDSAFWGKGIATEAAQAIKEYAFNQLNIPHLISIIHVENMASKQVAKKVGLSYMKQTNFKGVLVDVFYIKN